MVMVKMSKNFNNLAIAKFRLTKLILEFHCQKWIDHAYQANGSKTVTTTT
jgi:hypothetical protein